MRIMNGCRAVLFNRLQIFQADIQHGSGMGQRAAGNIVHADLGYFFQPFFRYIAGTFGLGSAVDKRNCLFHRIIIHII